MIVREFVYQGVLTRGFLELLNVPSPVRKIPSVSSSSLSSSKDSVKDVFKRLFFPNLTSTLEKTPLVSSTSLSLPKDSGGLNRGSSVGPVVPSGVCVLPGPSRVSSEEYDARMKSFRERERGSDRRCQGFQGICC